MQMLIANVNLEVKHNELYFKIITVMNAIYIQLLINLRLCRLIFMTRSDAELL